MKKPTGFYSFCGIFLQTDVLFDRTILANCAIPFYTVDIKIFRNRKRHRRKKDMEYQVSEKVQSALDALTAEEKVAKALKFM